MIHRAAVVGASGYAGGEVVRLLDEHPNFAVEYLGAHSRTGDPLSSVHPNLGAGDRTFGSNEAASIPEIDIAFLGLPHGSSAAVGLELAGRGIKVVDLGSDFRMDTAGRYEDAYGQPHPQPEALDDWVYGLPEFFRAQIVGSSLVASPGCYPTAALLAIAPLIEGQLIDPRAVTVNALSGVSGAGRSLRDDLLYGAVDEGVRAYGVTNHRHRPEIEMGVELFSGHASRVTFTPHLVPMQRGILATATAPATDGTTGDDLRAALNKAYAVEPFVDVIDRPPQTRWVVGSNRGLVAAFLDERTGMAIVFSAIDNLLKGAAGQAIQAANLMFDIDETAGLPVSGWMP
jgi:N-acetyl-gamma-glutamyl-phosphate reductase